MQKVYSFEDFQQLVGEDLKSITLRELTSADEKKAVALAVSEGTTQTGGIGEKMVLLSITEVNELPVTFPWDGFNKLNGKARAFISAAYDDLNSIKQIEQTNFLSQAKNKIKV